MLKEQNPTFFRSPDSAIQGNLQPVETDAPLVAGRKYAMLVDSTLIDVVAIEKTGRNLWTVEDRLGFFHLAECRCLVKKDAVPQIVLEPITASTHKAKLGFSAKAANDLAAKKPFLNAVAR